MTRSRWKSPVVWTAIAAQILSILVITGTLDPTRSEAINMLVASVLQVLVVFGVLNNPTAGNNF